MSNKLQAYMARADEAVLRLTVDYQTWTRFLCTAGRLYKYAFVEQAMIFAQRPDAVACAEYDLWKKRMGRYVYRGTTGIGLVSYRDREPYVRFVFDVSDTGWRRNSRYPHIWKYQERHEAAVAEALEARYEIPGNGGLTKQLARIAVQLAEEHWDNYHEDILSAAGDSFLEGLDVGLAFRRAAAASIAYAVMSRCGLDLESCFEPEDFEDLSNFNTVPVITQLGRAVSEAAGEVLRQVEAAIKAYRPKAPEARTSRQEAEKGNTPHAEKPPKPPLNPKGGLEKRANRQRPVPEPAAPQENPGPKRAESVEAPSAVFASEGVPTPPEGAPHDAHPVPPQTAQELPEPAKPVKPVKPAENFRITDDHLGEGGPKAKFRANMDAITTLRAIEREGRNATQEEQEVLSRYVGWGALADAFDPDKPDWAKEYAELKKLLTPDEYASAQGSVLNAHYTSPAVIRAIYEAVGNMGFTTGNILEPSCGVGNFFGLLPESMSASRLYGVELDSLTGRIAQKLYPKARIQVMGFEETGFPKDFFDLAVGNVPFGNYQVNDPAYNKLGFSVHNYFFAKALDQLRPGGILAFVTSRYTMDSKDCAVRKYLAERADLLGAIRLPNNAFKANAGTEVVTDILFLQKRDAPTAETPEWVNLAETPEGFTINSYFAGHPEMVLGIPTGENTQYGREDYTVAPVPGSDLARQLREAVQHIHGEYKKPEAPDVSGEEYKAETIPAGPNVKNHSFTVIDGTVYYRENSIMTKVRQNATALRRVRGMVKLRDCVHELIDLQMDEHTPDSAIEARQVELNRLYDNYTRQFGLINDRANRLAFDKDDAYYLLCSLEVLDEDGKLERKADMFTKRTIKQHKSVTHVDTASEALAVSIGERARVDLPFMAKLTGKTELDLIADLQGVIFRDPSASGENPPEGWQTADEYLSGNVRRKLVIARRAAERDPAYQSNVDALTQAQPRDLDASEIEVRLGATWIDPSYIQQFMVETLDTPWRLRGNIKVLYSRRTGEWQVANKYAVSRDNVAAYTTYGTRRVSAYKILEDSLNLRMAEKKRRARGEGSIRQRPNGTWEARFVVGVDPGTGKDIRKSVYGRTQKEVRKKMTEAIAALDKNDYREPCKMTLAQWLDIWAKEYWADLKDRTRESYECQIRNHIRPCLGAVKLEALDTPTIQAFYNGLQKAQDDHDILSAKTVHIVHGVLHKALQQAVAVGYLRSNPSDACTLPKKIRKEIKPLDEDATMDFVNAARGNRYEIVLLVAVFTGLRKSEVCGLTWDSIDFGNNSILVNKQLQRAIKSKRVKGADNYVLSMSPKSNKWRTVVPAPYVMELLKKQRAKQAEWRLKAGPCWEGDALGDFVFTDELGRHLIPDTVYDNLKRVVKSIGLPETRLHDLRHTYAVAAIRAGDDIKTVQGNLGHATASFTLDVYGHVTDQMKRESADRMQQYINKIKKNG